METLKGILSEHAFFRGMEERHIDLLGGCASNVRFEAGQFILREGQQADNFFLIRQGKVGLEIFVPGRGPITILTLGENDLLGWSWLVPPYKWQFDARATELTRAIALDGKCLREKSEKDHDLGYELLKRFVPVIEDRLTATRLQLVNIYETKH